MGWKDEGAGLVDLEVDAFDVDPSLDPLNGQRRGLLILHKFPD